jgi:hypothetical protein
VSTATAWGGAVHGVALGLLFNPWAAGLAAVVAAGLSGYPSAPRTRLLWSSLVVLVGWAAGDGGRIAASLALGVTTLAVWAIVSLLVGYALPAWTGAQVGRRVVHGTGWLVAGAVALMMTPALAIVADRLSVFAAKVV